MQIKEEEGGLESIPILHSHVHLFLFLVRNSIFWSVKMFVVLQNDFLCE